GTICNWNRRARITWAAGDVVGDISGIAEELDLRRFGRMEIRGAFVAADPQRQTIRALQQDEKTGHLFPLNGRPDRRYGFEHGFSRAGRLRRHRQPDFAWFSSFAFSAFLWKD